MILAREDIGWVESEDGTLTPFDEGRLIQSVQRAAERAGHREWWPAESIAAAIRLFLTESAKDKTPSARRNCSRRPPPWRGQRPQSPLGRGAPEDRQSQRRRRLPFSRVARPVGSAGASRSRPAREARPS